MTQPRAGDTVRVSALGVIACGSSSRLGPSTLIDLAQRDGWDVCVVTSPDGRSSSMRRPWLHQTGHPVLGEAKKLGDPGRAARSST